MMLKNPSRSQDTTALGSGQAEPELILFVRPSGVRVVSPALYERQQQSNMGLLRRIAPAVAGLDAAVKRYAGGAIAPAGSAQ